MPDKVKVLYDALAGEYDLGSFDEFRSKMSDQTKRKALYDAAGKDYDLGTFDEFNRKMSPAGPVAPAQTPVQGMPTFQEQLPTMQGAAESQSKYTPAVARDKSNAGKLAATIYNGLVGSFESLAGFGAEALGELATRIPTPQYDIGGNKLNTTIYDLSPEQQVEAKRGLKKSVREGFDVLKSGYVTKEEEQQLQGKFDLTNGIGLDDFVGLTAMSGRMAGDVGLGVATGGASFAMQAYSDSGDEYDEAAEKMGIQSNPTARMLYATTGAVINGLLEKYAIDKIVGSGPIFKSLQRKALANVLKNTAGMTGKAAIDAIQTVANREVRSLVSSVVPQLRKAGYRSLVEGGTEGLQTLAQEGAKVATNWVQEQEVFNQKEIKDNLFKNVLNSAAAGAVYGPVIGFGMDKTFGSQINMEVLNDIANAKTPEDFDRINKDLEQTFTENNFNEEERAMVLDNARRYAEVKQTLPADTPAEAQVVAIPKIEERIKLDNEIQKMQSQLETVDESLRGSIEQDISVLQDKRAQINDEVVEAVTGQKFEYIEDNGKFFKKTPDGKAEEITESRYNLEQIKLEEDAIKKGQGPIQEGGTVSDIGQRQGTQEGGTQKAPAQADSRYRNISSEETVGIPMLLGSKVTYKVGNRKITGTLIQEGQTLSVENETGDVVAELGNIDELSSMSPEQMNLTVIESRVEPTEQGFAVDGKELFNENENPFDAVSVDKNGNVMNVVLTTTGGKRRKFRGRVAQDLAAQISQKEDQKTQQADQRLQQEFALPTPTAPKTITTQPTIARLTEDNVADLDNVQGTPLQKKVLNDAKRVVSAIGAAVRNITGSPVSVNVHDQNSYTTAVLEAGGTEEDAKSRGFYMADDGSIHLNMDNIDSDTMLHEGFHPILDALEKFNPAVINDLFTQLESIPEAAEIIAKARRTYTGDVTQKKEAITDFVAAVADGRVVLNPSNFQKIKKFIQDMLQKLGIGQPNVSFMKVDNEQDLIKLANFVTEKFRTGESITLEGLEGTVEKQLDGIEEDLTGDKQYDSSEGVDIDGTVPEEGTGRGPQFSKSTLANARKNVKKISELVGLKISRVVFYDMTRVGKLSIKNIKTGYTPDIEGKGGPLYSYMDDSVENQAVLAFVSINQAIQSLQRQQMFPDAAHAVASQNPLTAHLGNKSTLRALFGDGVGIFQNAAKTKAQEKEIVNVLLSEIDRMSKLPKGNEAKKSLDKILPKVDLKSIKTINDFRDKILLGEGDSFGKRGSILGELLQNKQSKVTAATRDSHKILHYKYGIPTIEDIAKGNNQEELGNVELGDVVKFVRPSTEPVIYTTDPAMYEMYSKKPTPAMKEGGIRIELLPEASSHESYPFVLVGENVALLEEYVGAQQLYEKYKDMKKSGTFFKLGRMKKDAVAGQVAAETPTEAKGPAFQKGDKLTLRHGGESKIVKFDESKIKGGARGELGYGYYFSEDTKYKDYGKEVTSIDASSLNIVDENSVVPSDFTNKITEWQSKIPEGGFGIGMKAIAGEYIGRIKSEINANPSVTFQDLRRNVNNQYSVDREPMWSNMMSEIGIDGLAAMQGDGTGRSTMRQAVLYPNEKLNSLIIDQPQFQKVTPTKETRKPVKVAGRTIISSKAKAKIDHLFTSSGPLGPAIRTFKEQMGGELTAEVNIAERTTKEAMKLMEKYKGVITTQDVENFLSGNAIPSSFPLDLATKLTEMRAHVDKLTDRLLDLNVIEDKETRQLYMNNKGKYLLRSYELFRAKGPVTVENVTKKLKNVDQAKVDAALKVFEQQIAKDQPNLTPQELKQEAISQANFYLSDEDMAFGGRPIEGSVNAKSISRRSQYLEDNPAIRALMGEYTDPMYKYYSSIFKLANIVSHRDYLNKLKAEGMGKFLFTKATGEATSKIASWETKSLAPLGNLYTFPEIKEALMVAEREKKNLLLFLAGHVRMMKTVYNPATHVKNLLGSLAFAVSNGHWMYLGKTLSYMKKSKSKELMELIDVLNREGVLNNNIGVGEINQYFKKHDNVDDLLKDINLKFNKETAAYLGQKTYVNLKKIPNGLKKLYALEDDIFKILGFVNETNLYARAEYKKDFDALNPDEKAKVIKEAAERVKSFYPTFSRVPKFVKGASKAFFLGNFLSFPVESVRVSYNTINQGVKEARSSNPKIRAIGVNRLAGTLLYNGAMSWLLTYASMAAGQGLSGVLGYIFDDEDEIKEREKAKKYRAPWNKDSQVLVNKFSNGKLVYSDMGSIDSYGYQREVWNTFWDNMSDKKGFSKSMAETIAKTVQPYTELDMTLEAVLNIRDGKDEFGNDIANSEAPYSERVKDYTKYISSKFAPGVVNSVFKAYRLTQEGDDEAVINEALSQLVRTYTIDLEKSFTNYVYANPGEKNTGETGFKKRLDNAESIYNRVKNSKSMSDSEKETYYQMAVEAYKNVLRDVSGYYQAAIAGGVDANKLNQILMGAKLADQNSRPELNSIVQNRYDFPDEVYIRR